MNFTKALADAASGFSNYESYGDAVKGSAGLGGRLSKVALTSARENAKISGEWTNAMIASLQKAFRAKESPLEYSNAAAQFAAETSEASLRHFVECGNVAKSALAESVACFSDFGSLDLEDGKVETEVAPSKKTSKSALEKSTKSN